ncbi:MAG: hypothetical protein ACRDPJ_22475 [Nocardioidaceae bacterium]
MDIRDIVHSRTGAVVAGSTVLVALGGVGGAFAAGQITSADIKDQTIQGRDIGGEAVGSSETRDGSLGMRELNDFTQGVINSKAPKDALDAETSQRKSADDALKAEIDKKADKDHTHSGLLSEFEADGPYPGATNLQEGDNSDKAWTGDGGATLQKSWVSCPDGQVAIGGGFSRADEGPAAIHGLQIVSSQPTQIKDGQEVYEPVKDDPDGSFVPNAWLVEGFNNNDSGELIVRPWVNCTKIS